MALGAARFVAVLSTDKAVHLLDKQNGHITWSRTFGKEVTTYHGETLDGLLASHGDEIYWLLDHAGALKFKW
jgi:hypothetical protein